MNEKINQLEFETKLVQELRNVQVDIAEVYSPPRVTKAARMIPRLGILPGFAMDITVNDENGNPWDFEVKSQKERAARKLIETAPDLLVGSPMCKEFSPWQRLNKAKSTEPDKYVINKKVKTFFDNAFT